MDLVNLVGLNGLSVIAAFGQYLTIALLLVGAVLAFLPGRTVREESVRNLTVFGWTLSIQKMEDKPEPKRVRIPTFNKKVEVYSFLREFDSRPRQPRLAVRQGWEDAAYEKHVASIKTWQAKHDWELYTVS